VLETVVKKVASLGPSPFGADQEKERGLHELRAAVTLARSSRLIGAHEERIVLAAAQLSLRPVSAAAIPASEIVSIHAGSNLNEALIKAHLDMHTRFPVCEKENDPQTIIGYVNFKDIVTALRISPSDPTIRGIVRPIARFEEKTPLSKVLEQVIHDRIHIALVASEDNTVKGLVTLEDIIEELVGEIEDEYDLLPSYLYPYGSGVISGGSTLMASIIQMLGKQPQPGPPKGRSATLNEWCVKRLGRLPQGGDLIEDEGLRILVRKTRRKGIAEALVVANQ
jgi:putative hemolysin